MSVTVDVSQMDALVLDARAAIAANPGHVRAAMIKTVAGTKRDAQAFAPVDTGYLRSSITGQTGPSTAGGVEGVVQAGASYAGYVEFGTSRIAPHAFLGPAFDRNAPGLVSALAAIKSKLG